MPTQTIRLIEIGRDGTPTEALSSLPKVASEVCASTATLYQKAGFSPPWIGYLALSGPDVVGTCAFTSAPSAGRVEIAYFTFPLFERRGVASAMAAQLIAMARAAQPDIEVFAHTLPEPNVSNRLLSRLGFEFAGQVIDADDGPVWEWRLAPSSNSAIQPSAPR